MAIADGLGLGARCLKWRGPYPENAIQETARRARYQLLTAAITEEARNDGVDISDIALVLGHHRDDVVETVLMRLARGAGVDGLSAIQPEIAIGPLKIFRPLLDIPKARLLATIEGTGLVAVSDPSNADERFERVRLRTPSAQRARESLALTDTALARSAVRLSRARAALESAVDAALCPELSTPLLARAGIFRWRWPRGALPDEIAIRLISRLLPVLGGTRARPPLSRIERLWQRMGADGFTRMTLMNCIIAREPPAMARVTGQSGGYLIYREPARGTLPNIVIDEGGLGVPVIWDNRFEIRLSNQEAASANGLSRPRLRIRPAARQDLELFDFDPISVRETFPIEALGATPIIEVDGSMMHLPALDLTRGTSPHHLICRFLTEAFVAKDPSETPVAATEPPLDC